MDRIAQLIDKLKQLSEGQNSLIDTDLMLDHTRRLYEALLESRNTQISISVPDAVAPEPLPAAASGPEVVPQPQPVATGEKPAPVEEPKPEFKPEPIKIPTFVPVEKKKKDIRALIGINDKYQVMSELFSNDKAAYEEALDAFNEQEDIHGALSLISERYLWQEESYTTQMFVDLLRKFYSTN